jgi:hypothetical protein
MKSLQTPHIGLFNHNSFMKEIGNLIIDSFSLSHSRTQNFDDVKRGQRKECFGIFGLCEAEGTERGRLVDGVGAV